MKKVKANDNQKREPFILEKPLPRGIFNGVVLALLMIGAQHQGWFGDNMPVRGADVLRAVLYGLVFGGVMYLYALWRQKRQEKRSNGN